MNETEEAINEETLVKHEVDFSSVDLDEEGNDVSCAAAASDVPMVPKTVSVDEKLDLSLVKQEVDFEVDLEEHKTDLNNGISDVIETTNSSSEITSQTKPDERTDVVKVEITDAVFSDKEEYNSENTDQTINIIKVENIDVATNEESEDSDAIGGCVCSVCGRGFSSAHALDEHMRVHDGQKLFPCEECAKTFLLPIQLTHHMKTHSKGNVEGSKLLGFNERVKLKMASQMRDGKYKCSDCGKTYKRADNLASHRATHSIAKPYKCDVCGLAFKTLATYSSHSLLHNGKICPTCGKRVKSLIMHLRTCRGTPG